MAGANQSGDFKPVKPAVFRPNTMAVEAPIENKRSRLIWPAAVLVLATIVLLGLFSMRIIELDVEPDEFNIKANHWLSVRLGNRLFIPSGDHLLTVTAVGYKTIRQPYQVSDEAQTRILNLKLEKMPGRIHIESIPIDAQVRLGANILGRTPLTASIAAGTHQLLVTNEPLYLPTEVTIEVIGLNQEQSLEVQLEPNYGEISLQTVPETTSVWIDDDEVGVTPGNFRLGAGLRLVRLSHPEYQDYLLRINTEAGELVTQPLIRLKLKPVSVALHSTPEGANVLADGSWLGITPLQLPMVLNETYKLLLQKAGYETIDGSYSLADAKAQVLHFKLKPVEGDVVFSVTPNDAEIFVDGASVGKGSRTLLLPSTLHEIKVVKEGYTDYVTQVLPEQGVKQRLKIKLLTIAEMRRHSLAKTYTNQQQQSFQLVEPGLVKMGGYRNEPGFQFDQKRRDVQLPAQFYIGLHEVTNLQYRAFKPAHNSGVKGRLNLNAGSHPVVQISWLDAVRYCNWLSMKENLQLAYRILANDKVEWIQNASGYRLPTESEWAWVARQPEGGKPLIYSWGNKNFANPQDRLGNFAEKDAGTQVLRDLPISYRDGFRGTAPVGQFAANLLGLFDLAGNVSEWVYDNYSLTPGNNYSGPVNASPQKIIRGSSWRHGFTRELRLAFRRGGVNPEQDVGFRLARTP